MENQAIRILSVRENPEICRAAIDYIASKWTDEAGKMMYDDCISHTPQAKGPLPEWFLALRGATPVGCAGVIPNDFISRADLLPWLCALYVETPERGRGLGGRLIARAREYAASRGFDAIYICTDHIGYYERYGAEYVGTGYHPWHETSRIYRLETMK